MSKNHSDEEDDDYDESDNDSDNERELQRSSSSTSNAKKLHALASAGGSPTMKGSATVGGASAKRLQLLQTTKLATRNELVSFAKQTKEDKKKETEEKKPKKTLKTALKTTSGASPKKPSLREQMLKAETGELDNSPGVSPDVQRKGPQSKFSGENSCVDLTEEEQKRSDITLLTLMIHNIVTAGQHIAVCGSLKEIGEWDHKNAKKMVQFKGGDTNFKLELSLPSDSYFEYKYVVLDDACNVIRWEARCKRELQLMGTKAYKIIDIFGVEDVETEITRNEEAKRKQFENELARLEEEAQEKRKKRLEERKKREEQLKKDEAELSKATKNLSEEEAKKIAQDHMREKEKEERQKIVEEEARKREEERKKRMEEQKQKEEARKKKLEEELNKAETEREKERQERKKRLDELKKKREDAEKQRLKEEEEYEVARKQRAEDRKKRDEQLKSAEEELQKKKEILRSKSPSGRIGLGTTRPDYSPSATTPASPGSNRPAPSSPAPSSPAPTSGDDELEKRKALMKKQREERIRAEEEEARKAEEERKKRELERKKKADERKKARDAERDAEQQQRDEASRIQREKEEQQRKIKDEELRQEKEFEKILEKQRAEELRIFNLYQPTRFEKEIPFPAATKFGLDSLYDTKKNIRWKALKDHLLKQGKLTNECAIEIIKRGTDLLKAESNIVDLEAPVVVCGDIHGQFYDLTAKLMDLAGDPDFTHYLFLGDYVDRGHFSSEVVFYLWACKIQFPKNIHLLRGNHECRSITQHYNFKAECLTKYSMELYDLVMESFDALPLAATVNTPYGRFLCVHAGIGPGIKTLEDIQKIERFQEPPERGPLCDILWSDPVDESLSLTEKELGDWFLVNFKTNSTRGCSYLFGNAALTRFLETNQLTCIVRGHEVQKYGYCEHMMKRTDITTPLVITIFSAPNYCDKYENLGAFLKLSETEYQFNQMTWAEHPYVLPQFLDAFTFTLPFVAENVAKVLLNVLRFCIDAMETTDADSAALKTLREKFQKKNQGISKLMILLKNQREANEGMVTPFATKYFANMAMFEKAIQEDQTNELRPVGDSRGKFSKIKSSPALRQAMANTRRPVVPQRQSTFHFSTKKIDKMDFI